MAQLTQLEAKCAKSAKSDKANIINKKIKILNIMKKTKLFKTLLVLGVLITSINTAWAGDPSIGKFGVQFRDDNGTFWKESTSGDNCINGYDFGTKTNFKIVRIYANGYCNYGNLCTDYMWWQYEITRNGVQVKDWFSMSRDAVGDWNNCNPVSYYWGTEDSETARVELVRDLLPGGYQMNFVLKFTGNSSSGCGVDYYCKYSENNWYFNWTIPDPTISFTANHTPVKGQPVTLSTTVSDWPNGMTIKSVTYKHNGTTISTPSSSLSSTSYTHTPTTAGDDMYSVEVVCTFGSAGDVTYTEYLDVTDSYTVTYGSHTNGSFTIEVPNIVAASSNEPAASGQTVNIVATGNTGYNFSSWDVYKTGTPATKVSTNSGSYSTYFTMPAYGVTVDAAFSAKQTSITLNQNGATTSSSPTSVTATYNSSSLSSSITAPAKTGGYSFAGWYSGTGGTGSRVIDENGALVASVASYTGAGGIWQKEDATCNLYAKWVSVYSVSSDVTSICPGSTATVTLSGSENISGYTYQLKKNGTNEGAAKAGTGSALTWTDLTGGTYTVYAVVDGHEYLMSGSPEVTALSDVSITGQPSDVDDLLTTGSTDLSVTATGSGLTYQWFTCTSEGVKIADITSSADGETNYTTATMTVAKENSGVYYYKCKVTGTCSNETSDLVTVTVTRPEKEAATGGDWDDLWGGSEPTSADSLVLKKPVVVNVEHAKAYTIVLDKSDKNDAALTIEPGMGLELEGKITVWNGSAYVAPTASDLVLESSEESGNASLIFDNSNNAEATVQMYSKADISDASSASGWHWQYVGVPYKSVSALQYYGAYLYSWNGRGWSAVANGGTLTQFTGYCITSSSAETYTTSGELVTDKSQKIEFTGKFAVIGNSWTAPIQISQMDGEDFDGVDQTIYLFNTGNDVNGNGGKGTSAGTYHVVPIDETGSVGISKISALQGFYVKSTSGSGGILTLDYDKHVRTSGDNTPANGAMYAPKRQTANNRQVMKVIANGSRFGANVLFIEQADFTYGYDKGHDGENINSAGAGPLIYTLREDGTKDAVSAIPSMEGAVVGFVKGEDNEYTMSFQYEGDDVWYLNDIQEQKSTLISEENTYVFTTTAKDDAERFVISATPIKKVPTDIDNVNGENVKARKQLIDGTLYIIRDGRFYNAEGAVVK